VLEPFHRRILKFLTMITAGHFPTFSELLNWAFSTLGNELKHWSHQETTNLAITVILSLQESSAMPYGFPVVSARASETSRILSPNVGRLGDIGTLDEVFIRIKGKQQYLWRAVDQDGDVIDIVVQPHRDRRAAERFFEDCCAARKRTISIITTY
jgi:hypothetical protein